MTDTNHSPHNAQRDADQAAGQGSKDEAMPHRDSRFRTAMEDAGALIAFGIDVVKSIPTCLRLYPAEVARQCASLIRSNAIVILFMIFMLGALVGITTSFLFEGVGLESYVGAVPAIPMLRGVIEIVFGWVLAAKYGCGIVAELGAMRISEEVDAMDVMGVRSLPYLVGSRVIASVVVLPALFVISLMVFFLSSKIFFVDLLGAVSGGGYDYVLFLLQGPKDLIASTIWGTVVGFVITVVACFYGYNASGGPVGVGRNTAQAMLVNLVLISMISLVLAQIFYANNFGSAIGT